MKYFSKSPEEWQKRDEEKEREFRNRKNRIRRRANFILVVNFAIVFFLIFFTKAFFSNKSEGVIGPFQLVIETKESYLPNDSLDVRVKVFNREKKKENLVLEDFVFSIKRENDTVYEFHFPQRVEKEVEAFGSVLVFDLLREEELSNLSGGNYTITVSVKLNGQRVVISKVVSVIEKWQIEVENLKDFYFPYENVYFSVYLENISSKSRKIRVESIGLIVLKGNEAVFERDIPIEKDFVINLMMVEQIHEVNFSAPKESGDYIIELKLKTESGLIEKSMPLFVTQEYQKDLKGLSLVIEGRKFVASGERYDFSVKLLNEEKKRKYIVLKNIMIVLTHKEPVFSYAYSEEYRMTIEGYSSREIFKTTSYDIIKLEDPGTYKLIVVIESEEDRLMKEMEIVVSE